ASGSIAVARDSRQIGGTATDALRTAADRSRGPQARELSSDSDPDTAKSKAGPEQLSGHQDGSPNGNRPAGCSALAVFTRLPEPRTGVAGSLRGGAMFRRQQPRPRSNSVSGCCSKRPIEPRATGVTCAGESWRGTFFVTGTVNRSPNGRAVPSLCTPGHTGY